MNKFLSLTTIFLIAFSTLSILPSISVYAETVDEYFIYSKFDPTGIGDVVAAGGYVEYYGVPEWGDEIQYVYFLSGNIGYKVKVGVTDGDGDGKIEPRQHPDHYLSGFVGPIEPREFEIVSSKEISGDTGGGHGHTEEFCVDSSGVYLGAYPYGIHKWDHDWTYIGKIANSPPTRTESMAYNPAENVWYAGGRYRTIYQLSDTDDDGDFLDESWVAIFTYPSYGGSHHDGMEYVGGYLWISDMTSDVIGKWQYSPSTDSWEELQRFTYSEPGYVEGMGFGPNDHFWCGSGWGSGSYIYELGNEITRGYPIADAGPDVEAHPPTIPVKFDASGSHHTDPAKQIVSYEWDFESDGTWDYSGTDLIVEHAYPAYYNPDGSIDWSKTAKDYTATLRVTDNSDPSLRDTDTRIVHITAPPWKPVADPDGPYEGYAKATVQLDGSKSYDPESTMFPSDHPWYETIATYEWDLDHDGQFDDATGVKPKYTWDTEGLHIIGLKVIDSQPSGPGGTFGSLDVNIKYTTVVVESIQTLILTNREKLIEFAKFGGLTDEEANGKVKELHETIKRLHPEGMVVFVEDVISDPTDWKKIDSYIEDFWADHRFNYLIIVGNPNVIPFALVEDPTGEEDDIATDFYYSEINEDDYPDLSTGRIIGMTIDDMINNVKRLESQSVNTDCIVSSGDWLTDDVGNTVSQSLTKNGFDVTKLYLSKDTLTNEKYVANLPSKGVIVHVGHGNWMEFAGAKGKKKEVTALTSSDVVKTGLGEATPVVVGMGCHTAELFSLGYPEDFKGPYEISVSFISKGAAAFVGSTRDIFFKAITGYSEHLTEYFVDYLMKGDNLGTALMKAKRQYRIKDGALWWSAKDNKTLLEWVVYGDPKFNPVLPEEREPSQAFLQLGSSINITFDAPVYNHSTIDGYDLIEIPGAQLSTHRGYPIVPVFIKQLKLTSSEKIVSSRLLSAEKSILDGSFNILIDQIIAPPPIDQIETYQYEEIEYNTGNFYPGFLHKISVFNDPDRNKTAILLVAPLQYNKETGEVQLYKHLELKVTAEPSSIDAQPLCWEIQKPLMPPTSVYHEFHVENLGGTPISKVNITAEGEIAQWVKPKIAQLVDLEPGESKSFLATITIPSDAMFGFHKGQIRFTSSFGSQMIPIYLLIRPPLPQCSPWFTDSDFNNITSFRVVFTPYGRTGKYRVSATNPGQFYYNILASNTWIKPLNITIAYDLNPNFTLKGGIPIHVYGDLERTIDITPPPSGRDPTDVTISDNTITAYNVPPDGIVYVTIHLDYALKKTTWTKNEVEAWYSEHTFNATAETDISSIKSSVLITDPQAVTPSISKRLVFLITIVPVLAVGFGSAIALLKLEQVARERKRRKK